MPVVVDEATLEVTPGNADNLSIARWSASVAKELSIFITYVEVEAMLKKERENFCCSCFLDLKAPYSAELAATLIPQNTKCGIF